MLVFACISPHPPIILPDVGSPADRTQVKKTIQSLEKLSEQLAEARPDTIIISSPHPEWGVEVPLHFLVSNYQFPISNQYPISNGQLIIKKLENLLGNWQTETGNSTVFPILTGFESLKSHFELGKKITSVIPKERRWCWIASGDMSHRLKEDGPYGLHPSGAKFDAEFIRLLKKKDVAGILNLDPKLTEEAGECGLRSFCMLLGALEEAKVDWQPEILSYEGPFGVGYLVANIRIYPNHK